MPAIWALALFIAATTCNLPPVELGVVPIPTFPDVLIVIAVDCEPVLKMMLSVVPAPDVDSNVSVDDAVAPPITSGAVAEVLNVGVVIVVVPVAVSVPATESVLPEPTFKPIELPVPSDLKMASNVSKSVLRWPPHASVSAPTSGLVKLRLVVYEFAIFYAAFCHVPLAGGRVVQVSEPLDCRVHEPVPFDKGFHV